MTCASAEIMFLHMSGKKQLNELTMEQLQIFPLEYLVKFSDPIELLESWGNLPLSYRMNQDLQLQLPCFIHVNRPDQSIESVFSQKKCPYCNKNFSTYV